MQILFRSGKDLKKKNDSNLKTSLVIKIEGAGSLHSLC